MDQPDGDVPAALTKLDLVRKVSAALDLPLEEAQLVLKIILDVMVRELHAGGKVEVRHFGSFRIRQHAARVGRNPKTGAHVEVPAKRVAYFTPGKELRDGV